MKRDRKILTRISRHLLLNSSFVEDIGLLKGKMGIAIFFFQYSRFMKNDLYSDFANELIDEIYEELSAGTPYYFQDGLCGVVWGLEYLFNKKFILIDDKDLFLEIDKIIIKNNPRKIADLSLEYGLKGLAHYVISRKYNQSEINNAIPDEYICELINSFSQFPPDPNIQLMINFLYHILEQKEIVYSYEPIIEKTINDNIFNLSSHLGLNNDLGLLNGLAGVGFKRILHD